MERKVLYIIAGLLITALGIVPYLLSEKSRLEHNEQAYERRVQSYLNSYAYELKRRIKTSYEADGAISDRPDLETIMTSERTYRNADSFYAVSIVRDNDTVYLVVRDKEFDMVRKIPLTLEASPNNVEM